MKYIATYSQGGIKVTVSIEGEPLRHRSANDLEDVCYQLGWIGVFDAACPPAMRVSLRAMRGVIYEAAARALMAEEDPQGN